MKNNLNRLLSNLNIMYVKLHNFHYNIIGKDFHPVHLLLEAEYDKFHEFIDVTAELIKKKGNMPGGSMKTYLELATIKEVESGDYDSTFIYTTLINDYNELLNGIADLRKHCEEENVIDFFNLLEDFLKTKIWFFKANLK